MQKITNSFSLSKISVLQLQIIILTTSIFITTSNKLISYNPPTVFSEACENRLGKGNPILQNIFLKMDEKSALAPVLIYT